MALIRESEYQEVREAIDVELNKRELPDDTIALDIYSGKADRWVLSQVPDAESKTGDDLLRMRAAAVFYCASLLVHPVIRKISVTIQARDMSYRKPAIDPDKLQQELVRRAQDEIDYMLAPGDVVVTIPTFFKRVSGTRGM